MSDSIGVAIIGCGVIAPAHIESYGRLPGVTVRALCDLDIAKAKTLGHEYGITEALQDAESLWTRSDIQAVSVCTDHASHAPLVIAALQAGKHVLCEKPLAISPEQLDGMEAAARAAPHLVATGVLQHRFDAIFLWVRGVVRSGRLGELLFTQGSLLCQRPDAYYAESPWRGRLASEGGSLLINQAIHFLDLQQWIGGGVAEVMATMGNRGHPGLIETEDTASLSFRLRDGAMGSFAASSAAHAVWDFSLSFCGTKGTLTVRNGHLAEANFSDRQLTENLKQEAHALEEAERVEAAKLHYGPSHPRQIADFIDAIRSGRSPAIPLAEARKANDFVLAAYASARSGKQLTLEA
ncbi:MAG: Gfo/Idh/MocA family oxidoreductase [Opitutales bacterium]|nr:Gfo/Idh/MocA family oxidoreductase [Opitutales bacterium]